MRWRNLLMIMSSLRSGSRCGDNPDWFDRNGDCPRCVGEEHSRGGQPSAGVTVAARAIKVASPTLSQLPL